MCLVELCSALARAKGKLYTYFTTANYVHTVCVASSSMCVLCSATAPPRVCVYLVVVMVPSPCTYVVDGV